MDELNAAEHKRRLSEALSELEKARAELDEQRKSFVQAGEVFADVVQGHKDRADAAEAVARTADNFHKAARGGWKRVNRNDRRLEWVALVDALTRRERQRR